MEGSQEVERALADNGRPASVGRPELKNKTSSCLSLAVQQTPRPVLSSFLVRKQKLTFFRGVLTHACLHHCFAVIYRRLMQYDFLPLHPSLRKYAGKSMWRQKGETNSNARFFLTSVVSLFQVVVVVAAEEQRDWWVWREAENTTMHMHMQSWCSWQHQVERETGAVFIFSLLPFYLVLVHGSKS